MSEPRTNLEDRLRALGRATRTEPRPEVMQSTLRAARAEFAGPRGPVAVRARRRMIAGILGTVLLTLPVPLLFLYFDFTLVSAMLGRLLPVEASRIGTGIYMWFKICGIVLFYSALIPFGIWLAGHIRDTQARGYAHGMVTG
ncbi:MAG: hypothetical protein K1X53_16725 [Candidatus Sumerlaeaceae bacterium]|nr:hypothetical protein [Candidatus Sumerlaeaceae bacterium]